MLGSARLACRSIRRKELLRESCVETSFIGRGQRKERGTRSAGKTSIAVKAEEISHQSFKIQNEQATALLVNSIVIPGNNGCFKSLRICLL